MSGGRFDYKDMSLKDEIFGYGDKVTNAFEDREISELVWDVLDLIHEYDWYASGDTGEENWLKVKAEFKEKWLNGDSEARTKRIINAAVAELKEDLYKTFCVRCDHRKQRGRTAPNDVFEEVKKAISEVQ